MGNKQYADTVGLYLIHTHSTFILHTLQCSKFSRCFIDTDCTFSFSFFMYFFKYDNKYCAVD